MVRPTLHSLSLTCKCQSTAVVLIRPLAVAEGSYEIGSASPSHLPSVCLFSLNWMELDFSEFWHGARNWYEVMHDRARVFVKKNLHSKNWEDRPKIGFFEFKEKFGQ